MAKLIVLDDDIDWDADTDPDYPFEKHLSPLLAEQVAAFLETLDEDDPDRAKA